VIDRVIYTYGGFGVCASSSLHRSINSIGAAADKCAQRLRREKERADRCLLKTLCTHRHTNVHTSNFAWLRPAMPHVRGAEADGAVDAAFIVVVVVVLARSVLAMYSQTNLLQGVCVRV
jgi:hypothetical protein